MIEIRATPPPTGLEVLIEFALFVHTLGLFNTDTQFDSLSSSMSLSSGLI